MTFRQDFLDLIEQYGRLPYATMLESLQAVKQKEILMKAMSEKVKSMESSLEDEKAALKDEKAKNAIL